MHMPQLKDIYMYIQLPICMNSKANHADLKQKAQTHANIGIRNYKDIKHKIMSVSSNSTDPPFLHSI